MSDRLEDINRKRNEHTPFVDKDYSLSEEQIDWLIAEVSRLRSVKYEATHETVLLEASRSVCRELNEQIQSLQSQLEAVEKERDELQKINIDLVRKMEANIDHYNKHIVARAEKIKELESENALQKRNWAKCSEQVLDLEDKLTASKKKVDDAFQRGFKIGRYPKSYDPEYKD